MAAGAERPSILVIGFVNGTQSHRHLRAQTDDGALTVKSAADLP